MLDYVWWLFTTELFLSSRECATILQKSLFSNRLRKQHACTNSLVLINSSEVARILQSRWGGGMTC